MYYRNYFEIIIVIIWRFLNVYLACIKINRNYYSYYMAIAYRHIYIFSMHYRNYTEIIIVIIWKLLYTYIFSRYFTTCI